MKLVNLIKEGYFHLPQNIYQGIIDAYYTAYDKFRQGDVKRVTSKNFPDQTFDIDFSGSRYEFLNSLEPKPKIILSFSGQKNNSFFSSEKIQYNIGLITIDLMQGRRAVYDVIEHEMLHFVQYLVKNYRRNLLYKKLSAAEKNLARKSEVGEQSPEDYDEIIRLRAAIAQTGIGGLPPEKYISADVSTKGYAVGGTGTRRVQHSKRPIEYYPDLLSAIRTLHSEYYQESGSDENWETSKNSEPLKKKFFVKFMNDVNNGDAKGLARYIFSTFKEMDPEFYKKMLAIAYDAFVNRDPNFDAADVKKKFDAVTAKITSSEFLDKPVKVSASDLEYAAWRPFYRGGISLNTNNSETMNSFAKILRDIGVEIGGRGNLTLPPKEKDIQELFKNLAEKKKSGDVYGLQMVKRGNKLNEPEIPIEPKDVTKDIADSFYDNLFHQLRWWYSKPVRKEKYSTFVKFVNVSYGLPANAI